MPATVRDVIEADLRGFLAPLLNRAALLDACVAVSGICAANPASTRLRERPGFGPAGTLREIGFKSGCWRDLIIMQGHEGGSVLAAGAGS